MKRNCIECKEPFQGRVDKKFCSDMCRNAYNNRLNSDSKNNVRNINNILRKNRRILEDLNKSGKTKTHKTKLLEKGFDFQYFTNIYTTQKGIQYFFCYEQGYLPLERDFLFLVTRQDKDANGAKTLEIQLQNN